MRHKLVLTKLKYIYPIVLGILLVNCSPDAPRHNIFDPQSELYEQSGSLQGQILSKYPPYGTIPDIRVELPEVHRYTSSNEQGEYFFDQLRPGDYQIMFIDDRFSEHVDTVEIKTGEAQSYPVSLNGIPTIQSVQLITRHIAHWQPTEDEYVLDIEAVVHDYDGSLDIDSVSFSIPGWGFDSSLSIGSTADIHGGIFFNDAFGEIAFPEIQGEMIYFQCQDKSGVWGPAFLTQVSRLIVSVPQTFSPAGLASVDSLPVFRWSHFDAGFFVQYQVNVFRLDESAIPQFVFASPVLADTTLRWENTLSLASARYYWTLSVVDRYGNISVSKEASFIVESP